MLFSAKEKRFFTTFFISSVISNVNIQDLKKIQEVSIMLIFICFYALIWIYCIYQFISYITKSAKRKHDKHLRNEQFDIAQQNVIPPYVQTNSFNLLIHFPATARIYRNPYQLLGKFLYHPLGKLRHRSRQQHRIFCFFCR